MAEETFPQIPWVVSQSRNRQTSAPSTVPSSATEAKTTSSKPPPRRRSSPLSKTPISPTERSKGIVKRSNAKSASSLSSRDGTSRSSAGTMTDPAGEITYTPTTHRISKAKKGKKVHACEFPGCPKIFTRAEHRKRHEANHNSEPLFQCCVEDCRKPFQRSDLLTRHMERQHNMPAEASLARSSRSQRSASVPSVADSTVSNSGMVPATIAQPHAVRGQTMSVAQPAATMSIGSIIEPSMRNDYGHHSARIPSDLSHLAVGVGPRTLPNELLYGVPGTAESPLYNSSDSCYSPMSDYLQQPQVNTQRYVSQEAVSRPQTSPLESCYQPQIMTSPLTVASAFPVWDQFDTSVLGSSLEGSYLPTVGIPHLGLPPMVSADSTVAESSLSVPFSYMGGYEWQSLRNGFTPSTAAMAMGQGNLLNFEGRFKRCLECYWRHFHPFFPIVHCFNLTPAPPPPLLALMMVVIGAQFASFPESKSYSAFLYESCVGLFTTQDPITTHSPLSDMQTVILLEAFARYRSREARLENIAMSSRFQALYTSLLLDEKLLQQEPSLVFMNFPSNMTANALGHAKDLWTRLETKRRILLAAFVLDTQHSVLFQHQPCLPLELNNIILPYPQPTGTWDCNDPEVWRSLVSGHQPFDLRILGDNFSSLAPVDAFQSSFLSCYQFHRGYVGRRTGIVRHDRIMIYSPETHHAPAYLTHHALHLSALAPIRSLIIVSSGSWLFGTKITESSVWLSTKLELRVWVSTDEAARSVWHAIQILNLVLRGDSLHLLHEQWCIYLAALVCWAYGFLPGQQLSGAVPDPNIASDVAETQAREYLHAMNVMTWEEISRVSLRWHTRGVLECVRVRIRDPMGGLLNQAQNVLARLVEGRSKLMDF